MLAEHKSQTNLSIGLGLLMQIVGNTLAAVSTGPMTLVGTCLFFAGWVAFIWGTINYALGKGQHGAWGLLGIFSLLGLIVLILLPDHHR